MHRTTITTRRDVAGEEDRECVGSSEASTEETSVVITVTITETSTEAISAKSIEATSEASSEDREGVVVGPDTTIKISSRKKQSCCAFVNAL